MRGGILLAVALMGPALVGCLTDPAPVEPPEDGRFVTVWWSCGYVTRGTICPHWQLDADGTFVAFEGSRTEPGDGSIRALEGSLYNLSRQDVRPILETFDLYDDDTNFTVDLAYRGQATDAEIASLLVPAGGFQETDREHEGGWLTDRGTLHIVVESKSGTHVSSAYGGDGDGDFERMRDAFWSVRDAIEARLGVPENPS